VGAAHCLECKGGDPIETISPHHSEIGSDLVCGWHLKTESMIAYIIVKEHTIYLPLMLRNMP